MKDRLCIFGTENPCYFLRLTSSVLPWVRCAALIKGKLNQAPGEKNGSLVSFRQQCIIVVTSLKICMFSVIRTPLTRKQSSFFSLTLTKKITISIPRRKFAATWLASVRGHRPWLSFFRSTKRSCPSRYFCFCSYNWHTASGEYFCENIIYVGSPVCFTEIAPQFVRLCCEKTVVLGFRPTWPCKRCALAKRCTT